MSVKGWIDEMVDTWTDEGDVEAEKLLRSDIKTLFAISDKDKDDFGGWKSRAIEAEENYRILKNKMVEKEISWIERKKISLIKFFLGIN